MILGNEVTRNSVGDPWKALLYFRQCCQCRVNCEERTSDGRHDRVLPIRFPHLIRHGQHDRDTRCIPRRAASEQGRSLIDAWAMRGEFDPHKPGGVSCTDLNRPSSWPVEQRIRSANRHNGS